MWWSPCSTSTDPHLEVQSPYTRSAADDIVSMGRLGSIMYQRNNGNTPSTEHPHKEYCQCSGAFLLYMESQNRLIRNQGTQNCVFVP